jgi:pimeloyl-ACP methyl ester carboxylesterase
MERIVDDIVEVLDNEGIEQLSYFGYSMGGRTGFGIGRYVPDRFRSMILGGASYSPAGLFMDRAAFSGATEVITAQGVAAFLSRWEEHRGAPLPGPVKAIYLENDESAITAYLHATAREPDMEAALDTMNMPVLLFTGEHDTEPKVESLRAARRLRDGRMITIPDENHASTITRPDTVLQVIREFLTTTGHEHRPAKALA